MNRSHKVKGLFETLLIIGLILIIPLFFAIKTATEKQAAQNTAAPALPPTANALDSSMAIKEKQPPACTFPLAQKTTAESAMEEYTFSEPQVVLTASRGNSYNIVEWLPDNQQVLITEDLRNNFVSTNDNAPQQSISLYNLETGESKVYAMRSEIQESPVWQPELNAVVYPAMNYTSIDKKNRTYKFTRQVWVTYGKPDTAQMLDDNLLQLPLAIKPDGSEMVYLSDKKISSDGRYLAIGRAAKSHPADLTLLDIATGNLTTLSGAPQGTEGQLYVNDFIWAPDNHHLLAIGGVFSSQNSQGKGSVPRLYFVDSGSGQSIDVTPVDKFSINSPQSMAWSPDGSKLAIRCPATGVDQICIISVKSTGQ